MTAARWEQVDVALGWIEAILTPGAIVYLVLALRRRAPWRRGPAVVLALLLGLTVAQPFGVTTTRLDRQHFYERGMQRENGDALHTLAPLVFFRLYTRTVGASELSEDNTVVKLRSWVGPGLITNATRVVRECGDGFSPCWLPRSECTRRDIPCAPGNLELWRTPDGGWRVRLLGALDSGYGFHGFYGYGLGFGVASVAGVAYWLVAALLIALNYALARRSIDAPAVQANTSHAATT